MPFVDVAESQLIYIISVFLIPNPTGVAFYEFSGKTANDLILSADRLRYDTRLRNYIEISDHDAFANLNMITNPDAMTDDDRFIDRIDLVSL